MTTPAPPKAQKQKRHDCLTARVTIQIPLATDKPESFADAVKAVEGIRATMPEGTKVSIATGLGKI